MGISSRKINQFSKRIADLADKPNLGSTLALKQYFDSSPEELRVALNGLIDDLLSTAASNSGARNIGVETIAGITGNTVYDILAALAANKADVVNVFSKAVLQSTTTGSSGADQIGATPLNAQSGNTVQAILGYIFSQLQGITLGQVPDGTITEQKLAFSPMKIGTNNQGINKVKALNFKTDTRTTVLTYTGNQLTKVEEKDGATVVKTTNLTYDGSGKLTQVQEIAGGTTVTTTLSYTNGQLTSVSKAVS